MHTAEGKPVFAYDLPLVHSHSYAAPGCEDARYHNPTTKR